MAVGFETSVNRDQLPLHVGIIMDGNGRWAKNQGKIRSAGHLEGVKNAKKIAKTAADLGIKFVTLYVFSTENWKRTTEEVSYLMDLIRNHLRSEFEFYKANKIKIGYIGNIMGLPEDIRNDILQAKKDTEHFDGTTLVLAINYGGRDEIIRNVQKLVSQNLPAEAITEEKIFSGFDEPELPELDLLIRTGGEKRISNFLLWHAAYSEMIFRDTLWPDYTEEEFVQDIMEFQNRNRRFGAAPV